MPIHPATERPLLHSPGDAIRPQRIKTGRVRLVHYTESGTALELMALTPGDVLGFEAAVGFKCCWHVEELEGPVELEPATAHEAMYEMGPRLIYALMQRAEAWACGEDKACKLLADAVETMRQQEGDADGRLLTTHERLAEVSWATRETITRRLAKAEAAGLLVRDGRHFLPPPVRA